MLAFFMCAGGLFLALSLDDSYRQLPAPRSKVDENAKLRLREVLFSLWPPSRLFILGLLISGWRRVTYTAADTVYVEWKRSGPDLRSSLKCAGLAVGFAILLIAAACFPTVGDGAKSKPSPTTAPASQPQPSSKPASPERFIPLCPPRTPPPIPRCGVEPPAHPGPDVQSSASSDIHRADTPLVATVELAFSVLIALLRRFGPATKAALGRIGMSAAQISEIEASTSQLKVDGPSGPLARAMRFVSAAGLQKSFDALNDVPRLWPVVGAQCSGNLIAPFASVSECLRAAAELFSAVKLPHSMAWLGEHNKLLRRAAVSTGPVSELLSFRGVLASSPYVAELVIAIAARTLDPAGGVFSPLTLSVAIPPWPRSVSYVVSRLTMLHSLGIVVAESEDEPIGPRSQFVASQSFSECLLERLKADPIDHHESTAMNAVVNDAGSQELTSLLTDPPSESDDDA